jgi:hypothetical protein
MTVDYRLNRYLLAHVGLSPMVLTFS